MAETLFPPLVFVVLSASALIVLWLHPRLPAVLQAKETVDILRLGMGIVATITALVLGLLISQVKGTFDQASRDVQAFATDLILLDRSLRFHGNDADPARALLQRYAERVIETTWPHGGRPGPIDDRDAEAMLDQVELAVLDLRPMPQRPGFREQALDLLRGIVRRRLTLIGEAGSSVSPDIVLAMTAWLGLIFASFGYSAPRNRVTVGVLLVCAASVAGAVFLIMEIDGPLSGRIVVSEEPMRMALARMQR